VEANIKTNWDGGIFAGRSKKMEIFEKKTKNLFCQRHGKIGRWKYAEYIFI
jgi:hypothetical protein